MRPLVDLSFSMPLMLFARRRSLAQGTTPRRGPGQLKIERNAARVGLIAQRNKAFWRLNEPRICLDPSAHEDAALRRYRWYPLFFVIHCQPGPYVGFYSRQSAGASACSYQSYEDALLLFEPAAVRRHRFPLVHRRGTRPFRGA